MANGLTRLLTALLIHLTILLEYFDHFRFSQKPYQTFRHKSWKGMCLSRPTLHYATLHGLLNIHTILR